MRMIRPKMNQRPPRPDLPENMRHSRREGACNGAFPTFCLTMSPAALYTAGSIHLSAEKRMKTSRQIGTIILLGLLTGCNGTKHQNQTAKDWSSGTYVSSDRDSRSENAARVLDRAPEKTDTTMQVRTLRLPVHAHPSITSKVVGNLDRGDAVTVLEWSRFYNAPTTDHEAGTAPGSGIPTWAKVSNARIEGFVSARSLASPSDFAPSNSIAPSDQRLLSGSLGTPPIEGANYSTFEQVVTTAQHPATRYRQSQLVLEGWEASSLERDQIDGFASVSLEEHDPERSMMGQRVENIVQPMGPLDPELLASDSEGSFIDTNMVRKHLIESAIETYLESDGHDPDLHLIVGRELGASVLSSGTVLSQDDPRSIIVNAVGSELAGHSSKPYPATGYVFVVIENDEVAEAVATPIGIIYITTGMLQMLETDSELALILGHEIGHVEGAHGLGTNWGDQSDHFARLSAYRRVLALEATGELDGHIDWVLADVEIPEDFKQSVREEIREELLAEARSRYIAGMENAMSELRHGSNRELEIAADARAMSLASAAGYDPQRILVLLERFDATSLTYGGAQYPRARRLAALEILDQLPPSAGTDDGEQSRSGRRGPAKVQRTLGTDRNTLIICLENEIAHEEIRSRAMPALDEDRATLMSEKVVMLEFTPPSEDPEVPMAAGISLVALLETPEEPELEIDLIESQETVVVETEEIVVASAEPSDDSQVDLVDSDDSGSSKSLNAVAAAAVIAMRNEEEAQPELRETDPVETTTPSEVPMIALEPAMVADAEDSKSSEEPVELVVEEVNLETAVETQEETAPETETAPEVVFDPEHYTRFVTRHEFNQSANPTDKSIFADFISRHSEKETTFLRYSVRGHSEMTIEGPFAENTLALVIPETRKLSLWCVQNGTKHRMPDTRGSAHMLESADTSFSLVNKTEHPVNGWIVIGR